MGKVWAVLIIALLITACAAPRQVSDVKSANESGRQLRHVVLVDFKSSATGEDVARVEDAFKMLPAQISAVQGFEWGTNVSPENLNRGYTHCFFLTFTSERDRDIYLEHPAHKEFGAVLGPQLEQVLVVDYWTQD